MGHWNQLIQLKIIGEKGVVSMLPSYEVLRGLLKKVIIDKEDDHRKSEVQWEYEGLLL